MLTNTLSALIILLAMAVPAQAHDDNRPSQNLVSLSAEASTEVENDVLVAELYIQREGANPERLSKDVNQAIDWGVSQAKANAKIQVQTLGYQTNPNYHKGEIKGWRVRQSMRLESQDSEALRALIGTLQQRLLVQSVGYQVSKESQRRAEDKLIAQALQNYTQRARAIAKALGRDGYSLVEIDVNTSGHSPRPVPMMQTRLMAADAAGAAPPRLEAGTQDIQVIVQGTIQLTD